MIRNHQEVDHETGLSFEKFVGSLEMFSFNFFRPHIMREENHNLRFVFFCPNSAKAARSPSLGNFSYLTILVTCLCNSLLGAI